MDELLRDFLIETNEHLDVVDSELVRFELEPDNGTILRNVFRLVHTIKGTCGFLGLPRLESLAHAAESLMGRFRDGAPVTREAVSLILTTIDRIKAILVELERTANEPEGSDADLIATLVTLAAEIAPQSAGPALEGSVQARIAELERAFAARNAAIPVAEERDEADLAELVDQIIGPFDPAAPQLGVGAHSVRVNVGTLEHLMTMVSELVLTRNQLLDVARRQEDSEFKVPLQRLSYITAELQEEVMRTRMQTIGTVWQKLPRLVRDLSGELGKSIELVTQGAETELDRQVLEVIKDPLTHMIRNSADHGIETAEARRRAGKPERGTIRVAASHESGMITIEVSDDGRGLDTAAIRRAALERGIASEAELERLSDAQVNRFIFHPGFSTSAAITSVSGRGVGMDVVKTNVETIGGVVDIRSEPGLGTTFVIKIPLTLAIVSALLVGCGGQRFALPQTAVREIMRVEPGGEHAIERLAGAPVLRLRDQLLPIVAMNDKLGLKSTREEDDDGFVVIAQIGRQTFGILVDSVFHTEEIVVKPLSKRLRQLPLFVGNTILGDGTVVLIVDPSGIARIAGAMEAERRPALEELPVPRPKTEGKTTLLLFLAGPDCCRAVPLALVTRLEEADLAGVEYVAGRPVLQYRGRMLPLVSASLDGELPRQGTRPIVVFSQGDKAIGLVVQEIVDIVEEQLTFELVSGRPDIVGSALIRGKATEIIDVAHYLPLAFDEWHARPAHRMQVPSILLVDDSAFFRDLLAPILRAAGYRVVVSDSADSALACLAQDSVDVVVTDIDMPGRDGFELIEALRGDAQLKARPVIALASYASPAALDRARALGVSDFVAKFDRAGLVAAVEDLCPLLRNAA